MQIARVIANKSQLESIGISYDLEGHSGEVNKYFPSGYVSIKFDMKPIIGFDIINNYDIPSYWLEII